MSFHSRLSWNLAWNDEVTVCLCDIMKYSMELHELAQRDLPLLNYGCRSLIMTP